MKKFYLLLFILFPLLGMAQTATVGDYRNAKNIGNWSDADMWEVRTAANTWSVTPTAPSATNNVYVQNAAVITVTTSVVDCKDLQLNQGGSLIIDVNTVNVNGKMRAYTGTEVMGATDGTFYSGQISITSGYATAMATTANPGKIQIVGGTRTLFNAGEWGGSGFSSCDIVFNPNSGAIISSTTAFKFANVTVLAGTVDASTGTTAARIGADDGLETGTITIKSGATIISSRSGLTSQVFSAQSASKMGTLTIEMGGTLELTGSSPAIDATNIVNNGTVIYSRAGSQSLLQKGSVAGAADFPTTYPIIVLSGTNSKTPINPIIVSNLLQFNGTATIAPTAVNTLTMLNNSTIERNSTSGTQIPSTAGAVFYGTTATDLVNITIGNTLNNSNELPSAPAPGAVGTLTVKPTFTYTVTGGRTVTNVVANGILALVPGTTLTFNINGIISGVGTISGNANASVSFLGTLDNGGGTINFTPGFRTLNKFTVNRTGTDAFITLGTPLTLLSDLSLQAGTLRGGTNQIDVAGSIFGSGVYTATAPGKIVMSGNAGVASISSATLANLDLNNANGFTLGGSTSIEGTLTMISGKVTVPANRTLNINSGNVIGGAPFSASKYIVLEELGPDVGRVKMVNISSSRLFPIGTPSFYMPAVLLPTSAMDFSVDVFEGATIEGMPDGTPGTASQKSTIVDAIWTIDRQNGTGDCSVELTWPTILEGTSFTTTADGDIGISRYDGSSYLSATGTGNNTTNMALSTFNTFSPFVVSQKNVIVLPVNIISIAAVNAADAVEVSWKVGGESGVNVYVVEKSFDGLNYKEIGAVKATSSSQYFFMDHAEKKAVAYYRIRVVELSGVDKYSSTVLVRNATPSTVNLYPNPVVNTLLFAGLPNDAVVRILSANGQLMQQTRLSTNSASMDVSRLPAGMYIVEINADNARELHKIMKQ